MDAPADVHVVLLQGLQQGGDAGALLLALLKAEEDGAVELVLHAGDDLHGPQQHRGVAVVAAGVAEAVVLAVADPGPGQVLGVLLHGEGVDVGPEGHHLAGTASVQLGDDAVGGDLLIGQAQLLDLL